MVGAGVGDALADADGAGLPDADGLGPGVGAVCGASAASPCADGEGDVPTDAPGEAEPDGAGVAGVLAEPLGSAEPFGRSCPVFITARNSSFAGCRSDF